MGCRERGRACGRKYLEIQEKLVARFRRLRFLNSSDPTLRSIILTSSLLCEVDFPVPIHSFGDTEDVLDGCRAHFAALHRLRTPRTSSTNEQSSLSFMHAKDRKSMGWTSGPLPTLTDATIWTSVGWIGDSICTRHRTRPRGGLYACTRSTFRFYLHNAATPVHVIYQNSVV